MESKEAQKTPELSPGDVVSGTVEQIMPYGAFVRLEGGQKAMIHISQLSHRYVKTVDAVLQPQQPVTAKVIKIDDRGRIDLSLKALEEPPAPRLHRSASFGGDGAHPEDFEKKLSSFLKTSEEKISTLMTAKGGRSGRSPRRKGGRP